MSTWTCSYDIVHGSPYTLLIHVHNTYMYITYAAVVVMGSGQCVIVGYYCQSLGSSEFINKYKFGIQCQAASLLWSWLYTPSFLKNANMQNNFSWCLVPRTTNFISISFKIKIQYFETSGQFSRVAKHTNLLSTGYLCLAKIGYQPNGHVMYLASSWYSISLSR